MKYTANLQELWDAGMEETIQALNANDMAQEQQTEVEAGELSDISTQFSKVKQYSPRDFEDLDTREITSEIGKENLKYVRMLYAKNDRSENHMYVPIAGSLNRGFLALVKQNDLPVVMQVGKAMQAVAPSNERINGSVGHDLSPAEVVDVVNKLNGHTETYFNEKLGRWSAISETGTGKTVVVFFDFNRHINPEYMYGLRTNGNHVAVTMFTRKDEDDAFDYLMRGGYKKTPAAEVAGAISSPSHADRVLNDSVAPFAEAVNRENQEQFSERVQYSRQYHEDVRYSTRDQTDTVSVREYLAEMTPKSYMNDTEVELLKRYQTKLKELQEKQRAGVMRLFRHFVHASPAVLPHAPPPHWLIGFSLDPIVHGKNHNVMPCIFAARPCERTKKREMPAAWRMIA